ncbi:chaperone protein dnaJ 11, chloroplastic [Cornus florida]|uniref:chaperone protein dnaJ 11, chloroplastic n=1 Tax=Cornus florida TaxID=4283 RepID=UPI00289E5F80|nr:chaperone protein dnaJ 11, chloroplastic [Cornus florida]
MIGTLTLPTATSLRFSAGRRFSLAGTAGSHRKIHFTRRNTCKAAIHAFAEAVTTVDVRKSASLYEVLRVRQNASPTEIKTAYRNLAKLYHPDASHSESDGHDFIEIHNAYETLSDPTARALYDLSLSAASGRRSSGYSAMNRSGFYPTWRWETDQCW